MFCRHRFNGTNLVILTLDDNLSDNEACFELAQHLAELDPGKVRTVAFVRGKIHGGAGVIAFACDHRIMSPDAQLGGFRDEQETPPSKEEVDRFLPVLQSIADAKETDWSIMLAMMDPTVSITSSLPASTSPPARRTKRPDVGRSSKRTRVSVPVPSTRASSCAITASAPVGSGAPVKIRTACPSPSWPFQT